MTANIFLCRPDALVTALEADLSTATFAYESEDFMWIPSAVALGTVGSGLFCRQANTPTSQPSTHGAQGAELRLCTSSDGPDFSVANSGLQP